MKGDCTARCDASVNAAADQGGGEYDARLKERHA